MSPTHPTHRSHEPHEHGAHEHGAHDRAEAAPQAGAPELATYTPPTITASGTTWAQLQSGGASGHLERLIAAQVGTLAPTAVAGVTASGGGTSGGTLPAGNYSVIVTEINNIGETTGSPASVAVAVAAGNIPQVTFAVLQAGNTARNVYLSTPSGGPPFSLYAGNITAATFNLANPQPPTNVHPPVVNSTSIAANRKILEMARGAKTGQLHDAYKVLRCEIEEFIAGKPSQVYLVQTKLADVQSVFALLNTLCSEMGTLIDANPGTLGHYIDTIGNSVARRTWP
jgi:hypothetical protein